MNQAMIGAGVVRLDHRKKQPLFRQVYEGIRDSILTSQLAKGAALPSTRELADQLGVSRMTIVNAFDQLIAEGYLFTRRGSGTFVSWELPEERQLVRFRPLADAPSRDSPSKSDRSYLSRRGRFYRDQARWLPQSADSLKPFCPGVPALDEFPVAVWSKISRQRWKEFGSNELSYGDPAGFWPLRQSICKYVREYRGVRCEPQQIMIVGGTQQALEVASRLLLDPGDEVLFEDPGYRSARAAIAANGGKIVPMKVDENGAVVASGIGRAPRAKMAYVTPSHQYPLGVTMSIERRMELIDWAKRNRSVIIEDDYDSEYRYAQHPIPSLQGLDSADRTVYVGSFSKVVFPAMSMGYAIVPTPMVDAFEAALGLVSRPPSKLYQIILHDFIAKGHFGRHLRRMRKIHQQRRTSLVESLEQHLDGKLEIIGADAGLHLTTRVLTKHKDSTLAQRIDAMGYVIRQLSAYSMSDGQPDNGLVFGFACATPHQLRQAVAKIASVF